MNAQNRDLNHQFVRVNTKRRLINWIVHVRNPIPRRLAIPKRFNMYEEPPRDRNILP